MTDIKSAVVGAIVAFSGTAIAATLGYFNKDKELDIQLVNVGLSILRGEATGDRDTLQARRFALRLLREYAAVEIPENEFDSWAEKGTTPFQQTLSPKLSSSLEDITNQAIAQSKGLPDLNAYTYYIAGMGLVKLGCSQMKSGEESPANIKLPPQSDGAVDDGGSSGDGFILGDNIDIKRNQDLEVKRCEDFKKVVNSVVKEIKKREQQKYDEDIIDFF